MEISLDKKYRARDDREVKLFMIQENPYSVLGAIKSHGVWYSRCWDSEGKNPVYCGNSSNDDLVEIEP